MSYRQHNALFSTPENRLTPKNLANLLGWWRADAGITLATGVSAWADQSGNGATLSQATGTAQPTYLAVNGGSAFGGMPALSFASASTQTLANGTFATPNPSTAYFAAAFSVATGTHGVFSDSAGTQIGALITGGNDEITAGAFLATSGGASTSAAVWCAAFNGATSALYINSSSAAVASGNAGTNTGTSLSVGGSVGLGYMQGQIAELFIFSGAHTAAQRQQMMLYLGSRYLIGVS
jgi:hypothetical protein